jgi:hypothetical protein
MSWAKISLWSVWQYNLWSNINGARRWNVSNESPTRTRGLRLAGRQAGEKLVAAVRLINKADRPESKVNCKSIVYSGMREQINRSLLGCRWPFACCRRGPSGPTHALGIWLNCRRAQPYGPFFTRGNARAAVKTHFSIHLLSASEQTPRTLRALIKGGFIFYLMDQPKSFR